MKIKFYIFDEVWNYNLNSKCLDTGFCNTTEEKKNDLSLGPFFPSLLSLINLDFHET